MSAGHVTGAVALLMSKNPNASPTEIRSMLMANALPMVSHNRSNTTSLSVWVGESISDRLNGKTYVIKSAASGLCLDVYSGEKVVQDYCYQDQYQKFTFNKTTDGYINIESWNDKHFDVEGGANENGANFIISGKHSDNNQKFEVIENNDGTYQLKVRHSGKCLDKKAGSTKKGEELKQQNCNNGLNQRWNLIEKSNHRHHHH